MSKSIISKEKRSTIEKLIESQSPGTIGPRFVKAMGLLALATSAATKKPNAIKAFLVGITTGALGNNLNSWVGHRQGAHGSIRANPGPVNETLRLGTGVFGGIKMRTLAMHRWHHDHSDTSDDPHAPSVIGRGKIFKGIIGISERFGKEHPEYTQEVADEGPYTSPRFYEKTPIFIGSLLMTHMAIGKKLGLPVPYRLVSAGIHTSLIYIQSAMFTADVHSDDPADPDDIRRFPYGNTMNVIFASENGHGPHHENPANPRHSDLDVVYGAALGMRKLGLVEMPYLDQEQTIR